LATVTNKRDVLSVKGKEIRQIENEKRRQTCVGNLVSLIQQYKRFGGKRGDFEILNEVTAMQRG